MAAQSKRAQRRAVRKLRGELGRAKAEALMLRAMYYARLDEMTTLRLRAEAAEAELANERRGRQWMCTGLLVVPR